ncbi:MAG: hypothetical protein WC499_03205, partial [Patescibacteria group bacterium]
MRYSKSSIVFILTTALFLIGMVCFLFYSPLTKAAETNEIKIFPTAFSGDPLTPLGTSWQNPQAVLTQDLTQNAAFEEFNQENSAYPFEETLKTTNIELKNTNRKVGGGSSNISGTSWIAKIKNLFKNNFAQAEEITAENSTSTPPDISNPIEQAPEIEPIIEAPTVEPPISEPLIEAPIQPQTVEKILEISNFSVSESFKENKIENVQLRFSLAAKNTLKDTNIDTKNHELLIEYFYQNDWQKLNEFDLKDEISNNLNGGYFLDALPIFKSWTDIENLKIRFTLSTTNIDTKNHENISGDSSNISDSLVFLDAAWLEITTAEQPEKVLEQQGPIKEIKNFKNNEEPTFELTESLFAKIKNFFKKEKKDFVLVDPMGKESKDGLINQGNKVKISRSGDKRSFKPGLYKLKIK